MHIPKLLTILLGLFVPSLIFAESYYTIPLTSLKLTEGTLTPLPKLQDLYRVGWNQIQLEELAPPYLFLENKGEGFVDCMTNHRGATNLIFCETGLRVVVKSENSEIVKGTLFISKRNNAGFSKVKFEIPTELASKEAEADFKKAKQSYLDSLSLLRIPGAAWFRYLASENRGAVQPTNTINSNLNPTFINDPSEGIFDLLSGGKAVSENLQLDRLMPQTGQVETATEDINTIQGITVQPYDWSTRLKDAKPKLDSLASFIPNDNYAIFFPSFSALSLVLDEADKDSVPLLTLFESRSEDGSSKNRYQDQLCLPSSELSKLIGPLMIDQVAITGSDPYLRTGSDLSVIFRAKSPEALSDFIKAKQQIALTLPGAQKIEGTVQGINYSGVVSIDRSISSYLAVSGTTVLVSNSLSLLDRNIKSSLKPEISYQELEEYKYFRTRYPQSSVTESALVVISDDAIRKWGSALWRIANARRIKSDAYLADLEAKHLYEIIKASEEEKDLLSSNIPMELGKLTFSNRGIRSSIYGTRVFQTPIAELSISKVSVSESSGYTRWRDGYQRNWSTYFDPIALSLSVQESGISADLSVMPLILGSEYQSFSSISIGANIIPTTGNPHQESLLNFILALNNQSSMINQAGGFAQGIMPSLTSPFSWLGNYISLYADPDPFWEDLKKEIKPQDFLEKEYGKLPLAVQIGVQDPLKMALFLTSLRGGMGQAAPGMSIWENFDYQGAQYVKVSPATSTQAAPSVFGRIPSIYYVVTPDAILITLSESLLKRALDRRKAREANPAISNAIEWLGGNMAMRISSKFLDSMRPLLEKSSGSLLQYQAWANIPILNEWKKRFSNQDPVEFHQRYWHTKLTAPGGGGYLWNEEWQTMESIDYGHPGQPKNPQNTDALLLGFESGEFGLTFEDDGLRTRLKLKRGESL